MAAVKSIEGLSLMFTAGVAAGALLSPFLPEGLHAALLPILSLPYFFQGRLRRLPGRTAAAILPGVFLLLGLFCATIPFPPSVPGALQRLAQDGAEGLRGLIGRIPFAYEGTAPLLTALLAGDRSCLSQDCVRVFRDSGASHILALSGLHMGILYLILDALLSPIGRSVPAQRIRAVLVVGTAAWFTLMTGAGPSIVRAFLFITIREICRVCGRPQRPMHVLCLALLVQLVLDPGVIRSIGFQLSYLAMAGIFILYPVLERWYPAGNSWNPLRRIWQAAALSISCQVFTGPLAWRRFGTFPRHFLLTNLLAIPLVTGLIWSAVVTLVLSALDCCPAVLIKTTDGLSRLLIWVLEIISSL